MKQLSSCCRGEGSIELHRFTSALGSASASTEEVVVKKLPLRRVNVNKGKVASEQAMAMKMTAKPWLKSHGFSIDIHKASKKVRYFDG